jgi:hypothetical protein
MAGLGLFDPRSEKCARPGVEGRGYDNFDSYFFVLHLCKILQADQKYPRTAVAQNSKLFT